MDDMIFMPKKTLSSTVDIGNLTSISWRDNLDASLSPLWTSALWFQIPPDKWNSGGWISWGDPNSPVPDVKYSKNSKSILVSHLHHQSEIWRTIYILDYSLTLYVDDETIEISDLNYYVTCRRTIVVFSNIVNSRRASPSRISSTRYSASK